MGLFPWDIAPTTVAVLTLAVVYMVSIVLYATRIHPLRGFPGPLPCAISRIPFWWAYVRGEQARWMQRMHAIYGPVVRYGPTELSYIDGQAWKDIYGYKKDNKELPKHPLFAIESPNRTPNIVFTADSKAHAHIRRLFSPAFSDKALRQQEPLFQTYAGLMVAKLDKATGQPIDMGQVFHFTAFDIMADLTFGESLGLLARGTYTDWAATMFQSIKIVPALTLVNYYPLLRALYRLLEPRAAVRARLNHFLHSAERVERRLAKSSNGGKVADRPDIWGQVLAAQQGGDHEKLSLAQMHCNSEVFMTAGTETTASLLTGLLYYLLRDPARVALGRLRAEIRDACPSDADISFDRLAPLQHLHACLEESLRLYPPAGLFLPRVVAAGGQEIVGRWVPPGTTVSVHQKASYSSAANFKNPERFAPERWLDDPEYADDRRDVLKPFSYGPRDCIGRRMAYHEARLLIAKILYNFDVELCGESSTGDWADQKNFILWDRKPLMCRLQRIKVASTEPGSD